MGPVNNAGQFERVQGLLERTRAAGRDVRVLGSKVDPDTWEDGYFMLPAVVLDAEQGDEVVREEQFGPILPIVVCDTEEQAIAWANDTEYGLCSSVWSSSPEHAVDVAERIEAGVTFVNSAMFSATGTREIPMGGWKQSGIGWEGSPHGIDEYLQFHSIDVHALPGADRRRNRRERRDGLRASAAAVGRCTDRRRAPGCRRDALLRELRQRSSRDHRSPRRRSRERRRLARPSSSARTRRRRSVRRTGSPR